MSCKWLAAHAHNIIRAKNSKTNYHVKKSFYSYS